jgi:thiol:disulfide interchange protein DsbC
MIHRSLIALALTASLGACAAEPPARQAPAPAPKAAPAATAAPAAAPAPASASVDAAVRKALEEVAPGAKVDSIQPAPIPGFQEVAIGTRVFYVSDTGQYLLQGTLYDITRRESLTEASEARLRKVLLAGVAPERHISFAPPAPRHRVTVFTDIDCGYCRELHANVAEYNRLGIAIDYLFYPRAGLASESFEKAVSVWCAPDRRAALTAAKAGQELPRASCANPIARDHDLGRQMGLTGTPAIYASNGELLGGYVEPAEMLARLEELAAAAAK